MMVTMMLALMMMMMMMMMMTVIFPGFIVVMVMILVMVPMAIYVGQWRRLPTVDRFPGCRKQHLPVAVGHLLKGV